MNSSTTTTYNGWTNYETWLINLEFGLTDGFFEEYTADQLQEFVEDHLESNCENESTIKYALTFIDNVNWYEIAKKIAKDL